MTDEMLDALARQVLLDASGLGCSDAEQTEEQHTFSPSFERKMKKLIRRADHPVRYRVTQAVACAALVIILGGGSVLAFSAEARAAVFGWVREVYETYFVYRYEGAETIVPEETVYVPTWLPEGYEMVVEPRPGDMVRIVYQSKDAYLSFSYTKNVENASIYVEREGADIQRVYVGDISADLLIDQDGGANTLVWTDDKQGVTFWISAHLSGEDMIKIAESITEVVYEQPTPENTLLRPTWLPEGYECTVESVMDTSVMFIYENDAGDPISFLYGYESESAPLFIMNNGEGAVSQKVFVGNTPADYYTDANEDGADILVWTDAESGAICMISGKLTGEELIKMAESVDKYEVEPITIENTAFRPTWIPQGYTEYQTPDLSGQVDVVYKSNDGQFMFFGYSDNRDGLELILENNRDTEHIQVQVANTPADLYLDHGEGDANVLVWTDEENGIIFWIHAHASGEDMIRMAESVEAYDIEPLTLENAIYAPAWVPEGYELKESTGPGEPVTTVFQNEDDLVILITYGASGILQIENDGIQAQQAMVNEIQADFYYDAKKGNKSSLVWIDEEKELLFWINAALPKEDIIRIAESIELVPTEQ